MEVQLVENTPKFTLLLGLNPSLYSSLELSVADSGFFMQTDELLKGYVNRIQELELELHQLQHARNPSDTSSRPPSSTSSRSMGESTAGPGFGVAGIDGDIYLRPGTRLNPSM